MAIAPSKQRGTLFLELVEVMERLLAEDGCPWDREQTLETLKPFLLEETYEVLEALEAGDPSEHRGELGDLLLQVVFQAALRAKEGLFGIDDVCQAIVDKLRRRHPHVFGTTQVENSKEVLKNWEAIKSQEADEKGKRRTSLLDGIPLAAPALFRAQRLGEKAARVGFDWPDIQGVRDKVTEELAELDEAMESKDPEAIAAEMGDLLFTLTRLAAKLNLAPEDCLRAANVRFTNRFQHLEQSVLSDGKDISKLGLAELEAYWQTAKAAEQGGLLKK